MPNEAGDMKLLDNLSQLIEHLLTEPKYKPSNPALKTPALQTQLAASLAAVKNVNDSLAVNKVAVNDRAQAFETLALLIVRSRNVLKASGASKELLAQAEAAVRKVLGRRKGNKAETSATPPPAGTPQKPAASHSASQTSFANQVGNFQAFLSIVGQVAGYAPQEADLKLAALEAFAADLITKNDAVNAGAASVGLARGTRDALLYSNEDSAVAVALLVKAYVSGALGSDSRLNKLIKGLRFPRKRT